MRVLTILVRFGTKNYPRAEEDIDEIFRRQLPGVERTVVVVDNAIRPDAADTSGRRSLIGGDNTVFEFSGFDRAIEHVGTSVWSYDLVHFATSAFNTLYVAYLERFTAPLLSAIVGRPACCGHIDCYNEPVEALGFRHQHWIRSCFFFLPPVEAMALGGFVSVRDPARLFSGRPEAPFLEEAAIDATYRRYITDWLTGGDIGQGVTWHSQFGLNRDTLPIFERKALSIINEQVLAARLEAVGCRLVDVTWLSGRIDRFRTDGAFWKTPWATQLAHRDRDAIVLTAPAT